MKKTLPVVALLVAISTSVAVAVALADNGGPSGSGGGARDGNRVVGAAATAQADTLAKQIYQQIRPAAVGNLCAIAVMAGPGTSFNIRLGIFNATAGNTLDVLIEDSFPALGGSSLLHQEVFLTAPPAGGTLSVEYPPDAAGRGPVVLSFTGFDSFESASYNTDPDSYDNPDFGATVQDLDGTRLEGVFSGGLRCAGTLAFNAGLNASIANLTQISP
jgi:hypothetical protein